MVSCLPLVSFNGFMFDFSFYISLCVLSNMLSRVGLGWVGLGWVGLQTGLKDQLRLINLEKKCFNVVFDLHLSYKPFLQRFCSVDHH